MKNAFLGYARSQKHKLENHGGKGPKYAAARLRVLYQGTVLLGTGTFPVDLTGTPVFTLCQWLRSGALTPDEVEGECLEWENNLLEAYAENPDKQANLEPVNDLLLEIRKWYWDLK